jgi:hypothetical protein
MAQNFSKLIEEIHQMLSAAWTASELYQFYGLFLVIGKQL